MTPLLLKPRQVCELLSISQRTLDRLRSSGEIPAVQNSCRFIRFKIEDVNAWIEKNRRTGSVNG